MRKIVSIFCAATMALTGFAATSVTASAMPSLARTVDVGATSGGAANLVDVQYRRDNRRFDRRDHRRVERRDHRRDARRGFYRDRNQAYYNGHRGYRDRRAGYRQYNGYWFPAAAFIAGAIVGGAVNNPPPPVVVRPAPRRLSNAHVSWCQNQYRSYRVADNTFQPYSGPRRACNSPYG